MAKQAWQRTIDQSDLRLWLVAFFTFTFDQGQLSQQARLELLEMLKAFEFDDLSTDRALAWSMDYLDPEQWRALKKRVAARLVYAKKREMEG